MNKNSLDVVREMLDMSIKLQDYAGILIKDNKHDLDVDILNNICDLKHNLTMHCQSLEKIKLNQW